MATFGIYLLSSIFLLTLVYGSVASVLSPWLPVFLSCILLSFYSKYISFFAIVFVAFSALQSGSGYNVGDISLFLIVILSICIALSETKKEKRKEDEKRLEALNISLDLVRTHLSELARKRKQLSFPGDYGIIDETKWDKEVNRFIDSVISPFVSPDILIMIREDVILRINDETILYRASSKQTYDDAFSPLQYEIYIADLLSNLGWDIRTTPVQDQGIDIIITKSGIKGVIQCKKYTNPVGNKAVQEARTGQEHEGANFSAVVTNSTFTKSAKQLANSTGVHLLHHDQLSQLDGLFSINTNNGTAVIVCEKCNQKLRVTARATGRGRCPKCKSYFELVSMNDDSIQAIFN